MTEIEMDIDMAKPVLDGKIEDDLIDFDTDMTDSNQDIQKHNNDLESMDREMQEDEDTANHHAYGTNGMASEDVDFDLHDVEDTAHSTEHVGYELSEAPELQTQEPAQSAQLPNGDAQEQEDNDEVLDEIVVLGDAIPDDHASTHEIDYEFEDNAEPEESHEDVNTDTTNHTAESGADREASVGVDQNGHESEDHVTAPEQNTAEHLEEEKDVSNHDDENEPQAPEEAGSELDEVASFIEVKAEDVNADEYDAEYVHASGDNGEAHDEEHEASHEENATLETGQNDETVKTAEDAENHDFDAGEHDPDAYNEHEAVDSEHADHSATDEDLNGNGDDDFPAITVQYKGDEFPMFSATNNGFFANTSVLDEPLEKLLAGLRNELENELAEDDDLVLQVDELGLELAETTQGELMSDVTFRQILQIFDILVKNQDPDSSRTLYAYLFTKPNTEKRLESLIESATAGKGLDEVIHLFDAPMTAGTSMLETAATIDGIHEELDELDSPVDEEHHGEANDAELDDEYPVDEHANPDGSALENREVQGHETEDQDDHEQDVRDDHETDDRDDHDVTAETQIEIPADASTVDVNPEAVDDTYTAGEEEGLEQNAQAESEIDPFANLELDEDAELNGDVVLEEHVEVQEQVDAEPEGVHAQTNDTSTTTTLQEEEEASSFNVDLGAVSTAAETAEKSNSGEHDLDEIDWRDEPEADDQGPATPSASGKRSRGDEDDADAEDEQDAKRRRP